AVHYTALAPESTDQPCAQVASVSVPLSAGIGHLRSPPPSPPPPPPPLGHARASLLLLKRMLASFFSRRRSAFESRVKVHFVVRFSSFPPFKCKVYMHSAHRVN